MTLASLAMHPTVIIEQNRVIGSFLLETVSLVADKGAAAPALEVEASVAALDALFDVYGEERSTYDAAVFQAGGFLQTLSGLVGKYRVVVSSGVDGLETTREAHPPRFPSLVSAEVLTSAKTQSSASVLNRPMRTWSHSSNIGVA